MPTIVTIPAYFNYSSLFPLMGQIVAPNGSPTDNEYTFNFGLLRFIDGSGLTAFCNTLEWLLRHGANIYFSNYDRPNSSPIEYLDDCGFFERYLTQKLRPWASVRGTTLPFTRVAHAEAHGWLENRFTPWMAGVLGTSPGALGSLRTCVKEIFNNILDHSTQNIGYIHVQHYPNASNVRITISDFGMGIPTNVRKRFPQLDDAAAIAQAVIPGFTTKSQPNNMGVGLDFLITNVIRNQGSVTILSLQGQLGCHPSDDGGVYKAPFLWNDRYPGTLVDISLRTDCFVGDDEEEEEMAW